jgi:hypothetical protein
MSPEEEVIYEEEARYIGGLSKWTGPAAGRLVLTNKRIYFEVTVGGFRDKRPELCFENTLNNTMEVKVGQLSTFSRPVVTVVYKSSHGSIEQPSFQVQSPDAWKSALSGVKLGSVF